MSDIMERLRGLADLFEAGDAPRHVVLHMRAGADEIERLRAALNRLADEPFSDLISMRAFVCSVLRRGGNG